MKNNKLSLQDFLDLYIRPRIGWKKLAEKNFTIPELYLKYVVFFAFIPVLGHALGFTIFKDLYISDALIEQLKNDPKAHMQLNLVLKFKEIIESGNIAKQLMILGIYYILELIRPAVYAVLVFFIGGSFGGLKDPDKAFTVAVFSLIPFWIVGIFNFAYSSIFLAIIVYLATFYMYYLTYIGGETVLKIPRENSRSFQFIIIFIILYTVISLTLGAIFSSIIYKIIV